MHPRELTEQEVALAFAVLSGRTVVNEEDRRIAAMVMPYLAAITDEELAEAQPVAAEVLRDWRRPWA